MNKRLIIGEMPTKKPSRDITFSGYLENDIILVLKYDQNSTAQGDQNERPFFQPI